MMSLADQEGRNLGQSPPPQSKKILLRIVDYMAGTESMQLTRAEFEERGEAELLKLLSLIHISEPTRPY